MGTKRISVTEHDLDYPREEIKDSKSTGEASVVPRVHSFLCIICGRSAQLHKGEENENSRTKGVSFQMEKEVQKYDVRNSNISLTQNKLQWFVR